MSANGMHTFAAWLVLLALDVVVKTRGFPALHRLVRRWPVRRLRAAPAVSDARAICARVDSAAAFYFKRAWCLQRSAATVLLLRWNGFPARLYLGARAVPFFAHAWVEMSGRVINDDEDMIRDRFAPLEVC